MEEKKLTKISLQTLLLILAIIIIIIMIVFIYKINNEKISATKKSTELEAQVHILNSTVNELQGKINNFSEKFTIDNKKNEGSMEQDVFNVENLLGMWYETEENYFYTNPNQLNIKNVTNNKLLVDLYITRTGDFNNFEVGINENSGEFEAITINGPSTDGKISKINGKFEILNNTIKITILKSNVRDLDSGSEYSFKYHIKNSDISNYLGTWYEMKKNSSERNPNTLNVTNIDNNKVSFNLYLTRIGDFNNVTVYISNNLGRFEAITENGPSKDENESKITGYIELKNNTIKLVIGQSNVMYLDSGSKYNFEYKSVDN